VDHFFRNGSLAWSGELCLGAVIGAYVPKL
jgi:hypothetical protein